MKRYFAAGLAILLPIVLTALILRFFVNLLTEPFLGIVRSIFAYYHINTSFLFLSKDQAEVILSRFLILITLFLMVLLIGFIVRHFFVKGFLDLMDNLLHRVPIVNKIYKAIQEVMHTLFVHEGPAFSTVVLVPFPHNKTYSVGLITKEALPPGSDKEHLDLVSVFVPGTPNPTMGFMLLFRREQLIFVDMKVEDALKFIISCGVMYSGFVQNKGQDAPS